MHTEWTDQLSGYLDGELAVAERTALEAHLETCAGCREVLDDLRQVLAAAPAYRGTVPDRDLWPGIARAIDRKREARLPVAPAGRRTHRFTRLELAAAAVLCMAIGGGTVWMLRGDGRGSAGPTEVATLTQAPGSDPAVLPARATEAWDAAVADLERMLRDGRTRLDTATVRVVEENLALIDRAIAEARAAIAADPANAFLNGQVAANMRLKVDILRRATSAIGL
jgi:hypothetical protein